MSFWFGPRAQRAKDGTFEIMLRLLNSLMPIWHMWLYQATKVICYAISPVWLLDFACFEVNTAGYMYSMLWGLYCWLHVQLFCTLEQWHNIPFKGRNFLLVHLPYSEVTFGSVDWMSESLLLPLEKMCPSVAKHHDIHKMFLYSESDIHFYLQVGELNSGPHALHSVDLEVKSKSINSYT